MIFLYIGIFYGCTNMVCNIFYSVRWDSWSLQPFGGGQWAVAYLCWLSFKYLFSLLYITFTNMCFKIRLSLDLRIIHLLSFRYEHLGCCGPDLSLCLQLSAIVLCHRQKIGMPKRRNTWWCHLSLVFSYCSLVDEIQLIFLCVMYFIPHIN